MLGTIFVWKKIEVHCYSGHKANESPREISIGKNCIKIKKILDRWYEGGIQAGRPKLDYFKILTENNQKYLIRYNSLFDAWSLWQEID